MQPKKGFTLIELLIVIAIIGILSSIAVVSVSNVRRLARDSKRLADMRQIQTALEMYFNENNAYPLGKGLGADNKITLGSDNYNALCNTIAPYAGFTAAANCTAGLTMYLSKVPANPPPNGVNYDYTPATDRGDGRPITFTVTFSLEGAIAGYTAGPHELSQLGMK